MAAIAQPEMRGRLEEGAGPERRVALAHQAFDEGTRVGHAADPWKDDGAGGRYPLEIGSRGEERVGQRLVAREDSARARRQRVELLEGEGGQPLGDD